MKKIRLLNALLWGVNILLTTGIAFFCFNDILFPVPLNRLKEFDGRPGDRRPDVPQAPPFDPRVVWGVPLPMVGAGTGAKEKRPPPSLSNYMKIRATLPGCPEDLGIAVIQVLSINEIRLVGVGTTPMLKQGQPVVCGVTLKRVDRNAAYFDNNGREERLDKEKTPPPAGPGSGRADVHAPPPPAEGQSPSDPGVPAGLTGAESAPPPGPGKPSGAGPFNSRQDPRNPDRWWIDPEERDYIAAHGDELLKDVDLQPYAPHGAVQGFKVDGITSGSFLGQRGIQPNDIITSINGQPLTSRDGATQALQDPAFQSSGTLRIGIERAGRTMIRVFSLRK